MPNPPLAFVRVEEALKLIAKVMQRGGFYVGEPEAAGERSALQEVQKISGLTCSQLTSLVAAGANRFDLTWRDFMPEPVETVEDGIEDGRAVLERNAPLNAQYIKQSKGRLRRRIIVKKEPFAVAFIGDPHLENKGTNIAKFLGDMDLIRAAGIRAVNMGDLLDNFHETGKLAKKQAQNRMTIKEGYAAAKWAVLESGVKWDAHILGNHDQWGEDSYAAMISNWAGQAGAKVYPWTVGLEYAWEDGEYRVLAAHDFKGYSIHNPLHGLMRRAVEDGWADLYVAGHRHNAAQGGFENGFRERRYDFLRVKGYKDFDDYARDKGFPQQTEGASALAVIDPFSETMEGRARTYLDLSAGLEYLNMLKAR